MMTIGSLRLENWLVMAPMAGITNLPFRLMVKRMGAGLVTTEMVSSVGLTLGKPKTLEYLKSHPEEKPLAVQIFGSRPEVMARAAQIAVERGADIVDINMGCPVKKVVRTGAGASLLRNPRQAADIVCAVRVACPVPLTVKIRAGWSPQLANACEVARVLEDCGADAITVHPRFAVHGFSSAADWELIGRVKEKVNIPVLGNGDTLEPSHAFEMKRITGCDGVMIGRGAVGNPWIFKRILHMEQGKSVPAPDLSERRAQMMEHFHLLAGHMGEHRAALAMRGILLGYTKGLPHSTGLRNCMTRIRDLGSLVRTLDDYFASLSVQGYS